MLFILLVLASVIHGTISYCITRNECTDAPSKNYTLVVYKGADYSLIIHKNASFYVLNEPRSRLHYPPMEECIEMEFPNGLLQNANDSSVGSLVWDPYVTKSGPQSKVWFLAQFETLHLGVSFNEVFNTSEQMNYRLTSFGTVAKNFTEAVTLPASSSDKYWIVYYLNEKSPDRIKIWTSTEISTKSGMERFGDPKEAVYGLDVFDWPAINVIRRSFGVRTNSTVSQIFNFTRDAAAADPNGSPFFDNQVFFGCPQNFCFQATIDAITLFNGKIYLTAGKYLWILPKIKSTITHRNAIALRDFFKTEDTQDIISIQAMYTVGDELNIISENNFFKIDEKDSVFRQVQGPKLPKELEMIDAAFNNDNNFTFFFQDSFYCIINTATGEMDEEYLVNFKMGVDNYPRPISDFDGLPSFVDAAFYDTNSRILYFFHGSFVYRFANYTKGNFSSSAEVHIFQDIFIECENPPNNPVYKRTERFTDFKSFKVYMEGLQPLAYKYKDHFGVSEILGYLSYTIGGIIVFSVLFSLAVLFYYHRFDQPHFKQRAPIRRMIIRR